MSSKHSLDPHARPPDTVRELYKRCQKLKAGDLAQHQEVLDFQRPGFESNPSIRKSPMLPQGVARSSIFGEFDPNFNSISTDSADVYVYEHTAMPGRI
jgi:alkylated DNA repair protein alkB family protein 1